MRGLKTLLKVSQKKTATEKKCKEDLKKSEVQASPSSRTTRLISLFSGKSNVESKGLSSLFEMKSRKDENNTPSLNHEKKKKPSLSIYSKSKAIPSPSSSNIISPKNVQLLRESGMMSESCPSRTSSLRKLSLVNIPVSNKLEKTKLRGKSRSLSVPHNEVVSMRRGLFEEWERKISEYNSKQLLVEAAIASSKALLYACQTSELHTVYATFMEQVFKLEKDQQALERISAMIESDKFKSFLMICRGFYYICVQVNEILAVKDLDYVIEECSHCKLQDYTNLITISLYGCAISLSNLPAKCDEALKYLNKAVVSDPNFAFSYYQRGILYHSKFHDKYENALKDYNKTIELIPSYLQTYYRRGTLLHYKFGKTNQAMEDYNLVLSQERQHFRAYHDRGVIHKLNAKYLEALQDFKTAIFYNPDFHEAYDMMELMMDEVIFTEHAIKFLDQAHEKYPDDYQLIYYRGQYFHQVANDPEKALNAYNKSIELNPKYYQAFEGRALLYRDVYKNSAKASSDLQKAKLLKQKRVK